MNNVIFLFSLPRSGSTLLQRILMSHPDIASVAEPWLLLPFCYSFKQTGILAEYSHKTSFVAFEDFIKNLPQGEKDYYSALRNFALNLYEKHCTSGEKYFLDKTPRYYLIISEIAKIFPDAKFIFLFRNPIHVFASIIETWGNGRLHKLYTNHIDIYEGPCALSKGYNLLKDKAYSLQYEKFIRNPAKYTKEICNYLEIEFKENLLSDFVKQDTKGRLGDPTGVKRYKKISSESLKKWKKTFNNSFRKKLIYNYIKKLNEDCLRLQGYDKEKILEEIQNLKVKHGIFLKDRIDKYYSDIVKFLKPNIWFGKSTKIWARNKYLS